MSQDVTEQIAEQLAQRILRGRKILDACEARIFDGLRIAGKTLPEWGRELRVSIPSDPETDEITALSQAAGQIAEKIQKAEYMLAMLEVQSAAASNLHDRGFAQRYVAEMEAAGERVAAEKIKQKVLVDTEVDSSLAAAQAASLAVEYFKRLVKGLEEARRGVETRARLLGIRTRLLSD